MNASFHDRYHSLDDINAFVHGLMAAYPNLVKTVNLGHSAEGREMHGIVIGKEEADVPMPVVDYRRTKKGSRKHGFVIMGPQHAREVCI
jgi:extracellular matrix protein 14